MCVFFLCLLIGVLPCSTILLCCIADCTGNIPVMFQFMARNTHFKTYILIYLDGTCGSLNIFYPSCERGPSHPQVHKTQPQESHKFPTKLCHRAMTFRQSLNLSGCGRKAQLIRSRWSKRPTTKSTRWGRGWRGVASGSVIACAVKNRSRIERVDFCCLWNRSETNFLSASSLSRSRSLSLGCRSPINRPLGGHNLKPEMGEKRQATVVFFFNFWNPTVDPLNVCTPAIVNTNYHGNIAPGYGSSLAATFSPPFPPLSNPSLGLPAWYECRKILPETDAPLQRYS